MALHLAQRDRTLYTPTKIFQLVVLALLCYCSNLSYVAFASHSHHSPPGGDGGYNAVESKCYATARRSPLRLNDTDAYTLCNHAQSLAPLRCVRDFPSSTSGSLRSRLCSSTGSLPDIPDPRIQAPANCASLFLANIPRSSRMKDAALVETAVADLCLGTQSSAPGECAAAAINKGVKGSGASSEIRLGFSLSAAVYLCRDSSSSAPLAPVNCAMAYIGHEGPGDHSRHDESSVRSVTTRDIKRAGGEEMVASLCGRAISDTPALCLRELSLNRASRGSVRLNKTYQVQLCREATTFPGPVACVDSLPHAHVSQVQAVRLCKEAVSDSPAICFQSIRRSITTSLPLQSLQISLIGPCVPVLGIFFASTPVGSSD